MDNEKKEIRFIDSKYRELFRIQDGDSIEISYPDREVYRPAKGLDRQEPVHSGKMPSVTERQYGQRDGSRRR